MAARPDIALVSLGTTFGLRHGDEVFARHIREAGATCDLVPVHPRQGLARHSMATNDLAQALAARRAARGIEADAVIYSSITAALLQPARERVAVRFDGLAVVNRPGVGGAWQRRREPGVLRRATLLLPWSAEGEAQARALGVDTAAVDVPSPVDTAAPAPGAPDVVAYAGNPHKRGLELLCEAWARAAPGGARLGIGGIDTEAARAWLARSGTPEPPGVEWLGVVDHDRWLGLVAGARAYLSASRIEDFGIGQLEALAAGTPLVTAPAPGANAALSLARGLEPDLVASERSADALARSLAAALALDAPAREGYAAAARAATAPYREDRVVRRVAEEVLPRLLSSSS